jgi:hypothetical protein
MAAALVPSKGQQKKRKDACLAEEGHLSPVLAEPDLHRCGKANPAVAKFFVAAHRFSAQRC